MTQALLLLVFIGGAWAIYLVPPFLNSRRETPLASTQEYDRVTARLATVQGGRTMPIPASRNQVLSRRRRVLVLLVVTAVATLGLAVVQGSLTWLLVHLFVDAVVAWYVAMLLQIKQARQVPRLTPAAAPQVAPAAEPVVSEVKVIAS